MSTPTPPLTGIARKKRADADIPRKSKFDQFADTFRRMTASEQETALEVLRQLKRSGAALPPAQEETVDTVTATDESGRQGT